jgi:hypothetical protein
VAQEQPGEQPAVDVAARDDRHGRAGDRVQAPAEQRRDGDRPGALGYELDVFCKEHHRVGDLLLGDGVQPVEQLAQQRQRERAGVLDRDAVGDRRAGGQIDRVGAAAVLEQAHVRRARPCLHTHQLDLGARAAQRDADPAGEAAAAHGHDHAGDVGDILEQLQRERALPGDHVEVVERVHERSAGARGALARQRQRLLDRSAVQLDARTQPLHGGDLRHGGMNTSQPTPARRAARASARA